MKKINTFLILFLTAVLAFSIWTKDTSAQVYGWSPLSSGVNGNVYAIAFYNNRIIVAGGFTLAGGVPVNNIAQWDGSSWAPIGNGFNNTVYALVVDTTNNTLYAGGSFTQSGSTTINYIARLNGASWQQLSGINGAGVGGNVRSLINYNGILVGGEFYTAGSISAYHIVKWTGLQWVTLGSGANNGVNDNVYSMAIYNGKLIVGGKFTQSTVGLAVNHIATWDEANWGQLGSGSANGVNNTVYALTIFNSNLYVGGQFTTAGGNPAMYIAHWNGAGWTPLGQQVDNFVYALNSVKGELVAGGIFKWAGNVYGSRIAKWNGTAWSRMITGMNSTVNALFPKDSSIYAGGNFTTAGGKYIYHLSLWGWLQTHTISGQIRYADSLTYVLHGKVQAVRLDVATREIILIDSTSIVPNDSGHYTLPHVPVGDSLYIISEPEDEELDQFVPTYHPSTIDWVTAVKVFPDGNLTGVNINVIREIRQEPTNILNADISGYVYLNFSPPIDFITGYPYWSGSIVYAKQGNTYRGFGVSDIFEHYVISNLPAGTYDLFANRIGYKSGSKTIQLGNGNYDTANFYLDTFDLIGIHKIGSDIPNQFTLYQNYPNPFNPVTTIRFDVGTEIGNQKSDIRLVIYDILGREVATLVNEKQSPGTYEVKWNASNFSSGVYFYKLQAGNYFETRKMILIK